MPIKPGSTSPLVSLSWLQFSIPWKRGREIDSWIPKFQDGNWNEYFFCVLLQLHLRLCFVCFTILWHEQATQTFHCVLKPMDVCVFHCVSMIQGAGTLFLHLFALQQQWLLALVAVKEQHARRLSTSCTSVRGEGNLSTPLFAKPKIWAPQCGVHIPQQLATLTRCRPISQSMRMHTHPGSRCHLWRNNLQADFMTFNFLFAYFSFPDQC